jgi:hypothetical protein
MMVYKEKALVGSLIASILAFALPALGSHHFETSIAQAYPAYDLTDLFVFESESPGKTAFIVDINPQTGEDGKAAFGEGGLYNIHISADQEMTSGLTLTFRYSNGNIVVGRIEQPSPALGVEGVQLGMAKVGQESIFANGIRVWAGAAKDPFVGNAVGITNFRAKLLEGEYDESTFDNAEDLFGTLNSSIIVIEVPNSMLPKDINVFATSAMQMDGKWIQVNRLANVLLTHLFLVADPATASEHVTHRPDEDSQRQLWVASTIARAATLADSQEEPVAYGDAMAKRLLPDMIPYKVGSTARYGVDAFNGRPTTDDGMDVVLSIFAGKPLTDKANTFDHHPDTFPYVVPIESTESEQ